ncbi:unnamed protein product [Phytophthora fragariaefolia]|uniref:Unnamed protein product n=1 Tax=Phytophthora fragariaefolia TaxID=1490495 RepID=A0A9W6YE45_9STRA|nr:unnamed protein product [Phytophthora fragariaefolia]
MDLQIDDCDARVFQYFQSFTKIVEDNGLQALIGDGDASAPGYKDHMKARCAILVENIQPALLREQIERLIKYERRDCKTDDAALFDLILEHARVQQRFHSQTTERSVPQSRAPSQPLPQQKQQTQQHPSRRTPKPAKARAEALSKLRALRNARAETVQSKAVSTVVKTNLVRVNGLVEIPYIPDSGADRTMIPRMVVTSLTELSPDLQLAKMETPISIYLADGRRIECWEHVTVSLELVTATGPLNAVKSSLFQFEALWCGKLISGSGVRHDPERVDALTALPVPSTVAELQYFVCASNWLHDSLPDYARVVAPLQARLGAERKRMDRRNKNALNAAVELTETEVNSYNDVKARIQASVPLVFPSATSELVVMTDASLTGWSIVVTEVETWDPSLPVDKQQHRMVMCKGGTFKDSQLNWAIVEKEAFPIVKACTDLEYLLQRERGFMLFCDHANLIYIFAPHVELKKHVRDRLQRWAMRLCGFRFTIEHVAGETNVWADIISRWKPAEVRLAAVRTRSQPLPSLLRPLSDEDFQFLVVEDIMKAQQASRAMLQSLSVEHNVVDGVVMIAGKMCVAGLHIQATSTLVRHALMDTFRWAKCSVVTIHSRKHYYWQKATDICQ